MPSTTVTAAAASTVLKATQPPSSADVDHSEEEEEDEIYDEIEIEDMTYDATLQIYHYPCPCGDRFEISLQALKDAETDVAVCPSCSLKIRVVFEADDLEEGDG